MNPPSPDNTEALIGLGVAVIYELIAFSKLKDNSVLQLVLHMASELFPYELKRREPATRANRPRVRRDSQGRYIRRGE